MHRRLALLASLSLLVAACASGAAPATSPPASLTPSASPSLDATPSPVDPEEPVTDPGGGTVGNPGDGGAQVVFPRPGQLDPHVVGVASLEPQVDGRQVIVEASWWSGVEPCNVLDSVEVERSGSTFTISIIEGTGDPNAMCIEIAQLKATLVDLGELEPGTYTIRAEGNGEAEPVTVTVS